jgi:methylthioribose-1-phosphate isomerase
MEALKANLEASPDHAIVWRDGCLYLLDQRRLPASAEFVRLTSAEATAQAIRDMVVRGAPAIGITAAYAVVQAAKTAFQTHAADWRQAMGESLERLSQARPTAVNLVWALARMKQRIETLPVAEDPQAVLLQEARAIHLEDIAANRRMGELGAALIEGPTGIITHCNAGALATGGYGTALGVVRSAWATGRIDRVYADETRPWLQGSRLTAWELMQDQIPVTLLADGAAASRMAHGGIGWVIVGADRIAANGDVANKIGTYGLAVAARHHGVRMMVAAPVSTIDMQLGSGGEIPIEVRAEQELLECAGVRVGAAGAQAWNPVFDLTPAGLVDALVTERGVVWSPDRKKLEDLLG